MTAQNKEAGRLTIKLRRTKPPLVQLSHAGHIFNLSRRQLSPEAESELLQNPTGLEGADVEFESKNGQPWRVGRVRIKQAAIHIDLRRPQDPSRPYAQRGLEVGQVRLFRHDYGFLVAELDGRDDIRFYTNSLVNQHWRPDVGEAVTFVRDSQERGPVARQVTSR